MGSARRTACALIPHFALAVELGRLPGEAPIVLCDADSSPPRIVDSSPGAVRFGVKIGQSVREALARCPTAEYRTTDPARARNAQTLWLDALQQLSPVVAEDPHTLGVALVDLTGLDLLYGGDVAVMERLTALTQATLGLTPCVGIGEGPYVARIATRLARPAIPVIVPAGETPRYLSLLPVDYLPLPAADRERLRGHFGLRSIGEFAALPLGAVQAQFGPAGRAAWEAVHGRDGERLQPRLREETLTERLQFPSPTASTEALLAAAKHCLTRLLQHPAFEGRAARTLGLGWQVETGSWGERTLTLREPTRERERFLVVICSEVARLTLPGPVSEVQLQLRGLCAEAGRQSGFWTVQDRRRVPLEEAARQLRARFGEPALYHAVEMEPWSRIPERRTALIAYDP